MKEGIDAVIVDSVLAIRKGLTTPPAKEQAVGEEKTTATATVKEMEKIAMDEGEELQKRVSIASG